ncbi:MAG: PAS domain-containing protein, partial [Chitinophagaceae bacterium]
MYFIRIQIQHLPQAIEWGQMRVYFRPNCIFCILDLYPNMPHKGTPDFNNYIWAGGELERLMLNNNRAEATIGHPAQWPLSLHTTLAILDTAPLPMFLLWGPQRAFFYNHAFQLEMGYAGLPELFAAESEKVLGHIWSALSPSMDQLFAGRTKIPGVQVSSFFKTPEHSQKSYLLSFTPIPLDRGQIGGILVTCSVESKETTLSKSGASEDQLQFAIEAAELAIWEINPANNKFRSSPRLSEWHGLPAGEEFNMDLGFERVTATDVDRLQHAIDHALKPESGGLLDIEYGIRNPQDGRERIVRAKGKTTFDTNQHPLRLNGILQDISSEATALRKVEENEFRLRTLIEGSPIAMGLYTGEGLKIQYVNDAMIGFFGKTNAIIGQPLSLAVPELAGQPFLGLLAEVYRTGKTYTGREEPAQLVVDGVLQTFYFDYTYKALYNQDGSVFGIHHIALDVTQRVLANQALRKSEERFRHTVEQAPLGITILRGRQFYVEMANPAYLSIVNNTEENFVGKYLFDVLPQVKESIEGILTEVLETGVPFHGIEFPAYIMHNGQEVLTYFNFVYQPL